MFNSRKKCIFKIWSGLLFQCTCSYGLGFGPWPAQAVTIVPSIAADLVCRKLKC